MTIAFKPTATETTIEHNGSAIATLDSTGLTMAAGKTIVGSGVGKILQVVSATSTSGTTTTSSTFQNTSLSASITPSSTSSKIFIIYSTNGDGSSSTDIGTSIFRGTASGTNLAPNTSTGLMTYQYQSEGTGAYTGVGSHFVDSPNTTSATTYTVCLKATVNGQQVRFNYNGSGMITLMEIAG